MQTNMKQIIDNVRNSPIEWARAAFALITCAAIDSRNI